MDYLKPFIFYQPAERYRFLDKKAAINNPFILLKKIKIIK
ncbi:hypothetical protein GLGR_3525 [Leminorella grimontii ATCC 33999 = DSM 5078]|nr:hypothetical protein GLGR_3525 [Leminorella grimontii ATCC 33999 = DSM 5078]